MSVNKNLNKQFGIDEVVDAEFKELPTVRGSTQLAVRTDPITPKEILDQHTEDDVNLARETIINVLTHASDLMDEVVNLAKESQDTKAIDSTTNLLSTIAKISKDLLAMHAPVKQTGKAVVETPKQENTQNNIFVGTTDELQKMLEQVKAKKK
jgi:uncharacterized membrane protein